MVIDVVGAKGRDVKARIHLRNLQPQVLEEIWEGVSLQSEGLIRTLPKEDVDVSVTTCQL